MSASFIREANAWAGNNELIVSRFWNLFNDEQKVRIWRAAEDEGIEVPADASVTLLDTGFSGDDVDMTYRAVVEAAYIRNPLALDATHAITDFNQFLRQQAGVPAPLASGSKAPTPVVDEFGFGDWAGAVLPVEPLNAMVPEEYFSGAGDVGALDDIFNAVNAEIQNQPLQSQMSQEFLARNNLAMPSWSYNNGTRFARLADNQRYAITPQTGKIILVGDQTVRAMHRMNSSYLAFLHKNLPNGPAILLPANLDWLEQQNATEVRILVPDQRINDNLLTNGYLSRTANYDFELHIERNGGDDVIVPSYSGSEETRLSQSMYPYRLLQANNASFAVLLRVESWPLAYHEPFKAWLRDHRYQWRNGAFELQPWLAIEPRIQALRSALDRQRAYCLKNNVRFAPSYIRDRPRNEAGEIMGGSIVYLNTVGIVLKTGVSALMPMYMVPPDVLQLKFMQYRIPRPALPDQKAPRIADEQVEFAWRTQNKDYHFIDGQTASPNLLQRYHRSVHGFLVAEISMPGNRARFVFVTPEMVGTEVYQVIRDVMIFEYDNPFSEFYFRTQAQVRQNPDVTVHGVLPESARALYVAQTPVRKDLPHRQREPAREINGRKVPEGRYYCPHKMPENLTPNDQDKWRIRPNGEVIYDKKLSEIANTQPLRITADSRWKCYKAGYNAAHGNREWKASQRRVQVP